jgi:L-ascorbate metabolism protein UlaG (beta-lactamase superfamily)
MDRTLKFAFMKLPGCLTGSLKKHPLLWGAAALTGGTALAALVANRILAAPRYHGPETDHFDGHKFHNLEPPRRKGFIDFLRWQLTSKPGYWNKWTDSQPCVPPPIRIYDGRLRVTFVNHATVLVQMDGLNILTDPTWSERASPVSWVGPRRHRAPGLRFEDLPPIDLVLISHNHYDHLDIQTLRRLHAEHRPRFIVGLGNQALLNAKGVPGSIELDWWQDVEVGQGLKVTSVPSKHFSGRGLSDGDATLWCGYVIEGPSGIIYFAADTALGSHFREIKEMFGPIRLSLLPIGAYLPRWFMKPVHLSPDDAVEAHRILEARVSVAIHFGTFALGDDGEFEPVEKVREAMMRENLGDSHFWVLEFGEGRDVPQTEG